MTLRAGTAANDLFKVALSGSPRDLNLDDAGTEGHAKKLVHAAAAFVSALDEKRGNELRARALQFASLTETSKLYRRLRKAVYKRFKKAFEQAPPGADGELRVRQLCVHPKSEKQSQQIITHWDIQRFLGDAESVLWFPHELREYCARLNDLLGWPELGELDAYLYSEIHQRGGNLHLWGSFLLDAAYKFVQSAPDANRYGRLLDTVKCWRWAVPAMRDAEVNILRALPVGAEQQADGDGHDGEGKATGAIEPAHNGPPAAPGGATSQSDEEYVSPATIVREARAGRVCPGCRQD